ncbi:MAG: hypothetical protein Q9P14_12710 [candidate division KSB1 bacterium]|nr:hypothetical protein [candidate division KSB1 bacterium]
MGRSGHAFRPQMNAGKHAVLFDATGLPTGVYYYRLEVDGELKAKQMLRSKLRNLRL